MDHKRLRTSTSVREVREDLDTLWKRAYDAGASRPPPTRITFSREGWLDLLSDPEIRQCLFLSNMEHSVWTFFGASVVIDENQCERFKVALTGDQRE